MQYKVNTLKKHDQAGPDMEFTAKDDLAACELALKFAKMHKAISYNVFRKSRNAWHNVVEEDIRKVIKE